NSPLTYFNAPYFKRRLLEHAEQNKDASCVVVDAVSSFTHLDLSVMATLADIHEVLKKRGIRLVLAGRKRRLRQWCELTGISTSEGGILLRADMYLAIKLSGSYLSAVGEGIVPTVQKEPDLEQPPKPIPEVA
ncbi:sodium-independent anion transporter, partial [Vibrio parahaemolyticus]|nr:sodium-independent anion transporter [Vibrio parahaemolyticus]